MDKTITPVTSGYCRFCSETHYLNQGMAKNYCLELMNTLEEKGRIDFTVPEKEADSRLTLDYIKGEAGGQMFGVLECVDTSGRNVILKSFSGQYNGVWNVKGWVAPLFDVQKFDELVVNTDHKIKELGKKIRNLHEGPEKQNLAIERKNLSQNLMKEIHALYHVHNFRSEVRSLYDLFDKGIPAGAGDCCAPKLLNAAAKRNLKPVGLAEIYWGRANRSGTRTQGIFYSACSEKCEPVLGFMLCGIME